MRRPRTALTAAAGLTLAALLPLPLAHAAPGRVTVAKSQLPTVAEVARVLPYLAGGQRSVQQAYPESTEGYLLGTCGNWRIALKPPTGRWSYYRTRSGDMPYFQGRDDPSFFSYKYRSTAKARRAMARMKSWLTTCAGTHQVDGERWTVKPLASPSVGSQSLAATELKSSPLAGGGRHVSGTTMVVTRSGRYITQTNLQAEGREPSLGTTARLARVSVAALR